MKTSDPYKTKMSKTLLVIVFGVVAATVCMENILVSLMWVKFCVDGITRKSIK
jgi:hypothetical protein